MPRNRYGISYCMIQSNDNNVHVGVLPGNGSGRACITMADPDHRIFFEITLLSLPTDLKNGMDILAGGLKDCCIQRLFLPCIDDY